MEQVTGMDLLYHPQPHFEANNVMMHSESEMDMKLLILEEKSERQESPVSTSSGSSSAGGKRKRVVTRTLSVSL